MKITIEFYIFEFQLQEAILIFGTNFRKKSILSVENKRNENRYWIFHIRISLGTNFQIKLAIAIFWEEKKKVAVFSLKQIK